MVKLVLITIHIGMRVDPLAEVGDELGKISSVHVLRHLVENEPVTNAAVEDVVLDVIGVVGALEITTSLYFNEEVPRKNVECWVWGLFCPVFHF